MRPSKKRREIRDLARRASERARGGGEAAPPPPPPAVHEMACICGQLLRLSMAHDEKRCACPSCRRKFLVTFAPDRRTGQPVLCPVYLDDSVKTGETFVAGLPPAAPAAAPAKGQLDDAIEPPPPAFLRFACPCGRALVARQEAYDRRVRCPDCGVRMLLSVAYDPVARRHAVHPVRLTDAPSGETGISDRA